MHFMMENFSVTQLVVVVLCCSKFAASC